MLIDLDAEYFLWLFPVNLWYSNKQAIQRGIRQAAIGKQEEDESFIPTSANPEAI